MADPPEGHPASTFDDRGLAFLGVSEPAHLQLTSDGKSKTPGDVVSRLLQWHKGQWQTHPAEKTLQESWGRLLWSTGEAWVIAARRAEGKTTMHGYRISGPRRADVTGPYQLLTLDGSYDLYLADLSDHHRMALLFTESVEPNHGALVKPCLGRIVDVTRPDKPAAESIAVPPLNRLDHFLWSPKRELVATACDFYKVRVFALRDGKWTPIAEASQDASEGRIFRPRLVFRSDGVPIVTWEDFFPR